MTGSASSIGSDSATLNGTVNPNGKATSYHFEYGTTTSYGQSSASESAGSGTSDQQVSANISGLAPETIYHFRLVASNVDGTTLGSDQSFQTSPETEGESSYATAILGTSGLTHYWRLGEEGGATAFDSKGSADGTYNGGFTLAQTGAIAGDPDTSVSFDGSSGYLSTPVNPGGAQGTIEFWGYATDLNSRNGFVYTADDGTGTYSHQVGVLADGSVRLYIYDGHVRSIDTASGLITADSWHYYALAWSDGGSADLYVDGTKQASVNIGSSWKGGNKLLFGHATGSYSGLTNPWQGRIDEAATYNSALSASAIQEHYNLGRAPGPSAVTGSASSIAIRLRHPQRHRQPQRQSRPATTSNTAPRQATGNQAPAKAPARAPATSQVGGQHLRPRPRNDLSLPPRRQQRRWHHPRR